MNFKVYKEKINNILKELENLIINYYNKTDVELFYADYRRRRELLIEILKYIPPGATVVDAGCAPGFTSLALKLLGYNVICIDVRPEPYRSVLEKYGCSVYKVDLERDSIPGHLDQLGVDAVVFTEVLEHLNPYYVSWSLYILNRILKYNGLLILSTPNIASIGKRILLIIGKNPIAPTHVKEYTMNEVVKLLTDHGFEILEKRYSSAYDRTPYHAKGKDYTLTLFRALLNTLVKKTCLKS